ncbi:MAG TPA: hypothetical protein VLJ10_05890 [Candidatus Bathyarchaeia archaeon]|nr:hypothetical protein [Candidatus Bathyarchaeia archaeon]
MRNESGKALTIFLVLIAIILVSLTAISVFLLVKQVELRKSTEVSLEQVRTSESSLRGELEEIKKQKEILENKGKESEAKIESLIEELDLAQGVREEVKKENRELKDSLDALKKTNDEVQAKLAQTEKQAEQQVQDLQNQLNVALERNKELEAKRQELENEYQVLKEQLMSYEAAGSLETDLLFTDPEAGVPVEVVPGDGATLQDVQLDPIVVSLVSAQEGHVVSIDTEAEFAIVNLGERQGILVDAVLGVYRDNQYLGDIKVSRVLPEVSAVDFVPPLTSQQIAEGDLVKLKE